jgi:hypothetical protein
VVQSFLDDIEEVRDSLTDFADYASDARGNSNAPAVLQRAADKILEELKRVEGTAHVRARRIVTLGKQIEGFAQEELKRDEIGETLCVLLDSSVALLKDICRKHFAPSIVVLSALDGLDIGETPPAQVIEQLEQAILRIEAGDVKGLVPLRPDDVLMLKDMLNDLKTIEVSIGEARTDRFAGSQKKKLARGAGEVTATIGRYVETASKHSGNAGEKVDKFVKWYKRFKSLNDMLEWLEVFFGSGPPLS